MISIHRFAVLPTQSAQFLLPVDVRSKVAMARHLFREFLIRTVAALLLCACAGSVTAQSPPAYVLSGPLLPLLLQMPENSWLQANANLYSNDISGSGRNRANCSKEQASLSRYSAESSRFVQGC